MNTERPLDSREIEFASESQKPDAGPEDALRTLLARPRQPAEGPCAAAEPDPVGAASGIASGAAPSTARIDGIVIGRLLPGTEPHSGRFLVEYAGSPGGRPVAAASTGALSSQDVGRRVALAFVGGDPEQPIILGPVHDARTGPAAHEQATGQERPQITVEQDGRRLRIVAQQEIVLQCGKSSITLTRAGKVLIRGAYLLSRSSGVNRIKGGSVQIN
jgi:hypothetical protein